MSKSKRLMELMMTVNTRRKFTARELADEFGVSMRTILRDLQELSELGFPLYSEVGPHGGYHVLRERVLPPVAFTEHEATAIFFAAQALERYGSLPFETEMRAAITKFYHYLPSDLRQRIDSMKDRVVIRTVEREHRSPHLQLLLEASVQQQVVRVTYDNKHGLDVRELQPLGLYAHNGYWYLAAWCLKRADWRVFRADRMQQVEVLADVVPPRDLSQVSIHSWWQDGPPEGANLDLHVTFTREGVRRADVDPWLPWVIVKHEDGSGTLCIRIRETDLDYLAQLFFTFGPEAHVHGGEEMRTRMRELVQALADRYL